MAQTPPRPLRTPDLQTQFEAILDEVWRQESFERTHPFTCGVIRENARSRPRTTATLD